MLVTNLITCLVVMVSQTHRLIRIGDRKYLNEYTPFGSVSLWTMLAGMEFSITGTQNSHEVTMRQHFGPNHPHQYAALEHTGRCDFLEMVPLNTLKINRLKTKQ